MLARPVTITGPCYRPLTSQDCVVLIHGTWAPGSAWTRETSPLSKALSDDLHRDVKIFTWGCGNNSQRARRRASVDLACMLKSSELAAYHRIHLVGHSH